MLSIHYFTRKPKAYGEKRLVSISIHGVTLEFMTYSSLFSGDKVDEGTRLLLENIKIPDTGTILDIGCGYGVIGIAVAKLNTRIRAYLVDINRLAVKVARYNAKLNGVEDRVMVLEGDLFEPVQDMKFNAVYSNPPLSAGKGVVEKIIREGYSHLYEGGFIQMVLAKGGDYYINVAKGIYRSVLAIRKKGYCILTALR